MKKNANASNRGRVCLFFQNDTKLVDSQIVQFSTGARASIRVFGGKENVL